MQQQYFIGESDNCRLVFINGSYNEELSSVDRLPDGVIVGNLGGNLNHTSVKKYLNKLAVYENDPFTLFNGTFFEDGGFIYLPRESKIDDPIQILNIYTDSEKPFFTTPRLLVVAEEGTKCNDYRRSHWPWEQ
jgi:Fe-S cluster assembly protein SufD